jgi:hypothetical protein
MGTMQGATATGPGPSDPAEPLLLSLVVPAYNEGARLADGVSRLHDAIAAGAIDPAATEFIVVDDGSADDTSEQARRHFGAFPHVQYIRLPHNRGKGGAVRAGVAVASGAFIAFADADMAIDPAQTPQFLRALRDTELAIGSRAANGSSVDRHSLSRSVMNRTFNRLVNLLTGVGLDDTQCGFKAFRAPAGKLLFHCTETERFAFDVEILSLARVLGLGITEVPVRWLRVKGSQIRPMADARSMARDVYRASRRPTGANVSVPALRAPDGPAAPAATVRSALPPGLPVVQRPDEPLLILCPLLDEAAVAAMTDQILEATGVSFVRDTVSLAQLRRMAPLHFAPEDDVSPQSSPA